MSSSSTGATGSTTAASSSDGLIVQFFRKKDLYHLTDVVASSKLHRTLGLGSLTSLGVGCVVGAGIFVITGQAAALFAGPALTFSFILCAIPCFCTGMCYGELAAMIPIAGSAYSFAGLALGEMPAWFVAVGLTLENLVAAAAVSAGWSASVQALLEEFGIFLPILIANSPYIADDEGVLTASGSVINLPAVLILAVITVLLSIGVKESARFNNIAVVIKISVLIIFVLYGAKFALSNWEEFSDNLTPYIPPNEGRFGRYGISGIFRGAGVVFFANVGFDSICAAAQECRDPRRDLPRGILFTLLICTTLYCLVTTALTGMMNYRLLNVDAPVIEALQHVNAPHFIRFSTEIGTIAGLTSVCLVSLMSMPRLILTVAQDGLLPPLLQSVHPRTMTPLPATLAAGLLCSVIGGVLPLSMLGELVSFGTLLAFMAVCASMWRLRYTHPQQPRTFRCPFVPVVPLLGIVSCAVQLFALPLATWRNYGWVALVSSIVYFFYGRVHSKLNNPTDRFTMLHEEARQDEDLEEELPAVTPSNSAKS